MAKTIINLSDPVSTLVSKTNDISDDIGDITQLAVGASNDSDLVQAINYLNSNLQDSAGIILTAKSGFQKDSANAIGFDSSEGRFFVPSNTINTAMIEPDAIDGTKIADDAINSEHYTDASVDSEHLSALVISTGKIQADAVTEAKIADDAVGQDQMKSLSTLLIKDVNGSTLKTIHGAGA